MCPCYVKFIVNIILNWAICYLLELGALCRLAIVLPMLTLSVGVSRMFGAVCLSVYPQLNLKTNDPKVFKLVY